jgi:putative ABC transport system substrate-binding protein
VNQSKPLASRRKIVLIAILIVACLSISGCGEKKVKVYHVGILSGLDAFSTMADGFKAKMTELGYMEGKDIVYDLQKTNMNSVEIRQILKGFVDAKVDLIFTFPTEPAVEAKSATKNTGIPVVFACANIEGVDLVDSVSRPGGNITGARYPGPDLTVKRFEILCELEPRIKRLGIIYNINYPANKSALEILRPAVSATGIELVEVPVTTIEEIDRDLRARNKAADIGMDAILIMPDDYTQSPPGWAMLSKFAFEHKIPVAGSAGFEASTGAVFSCIPDNVETGQMAAYLADKIFKGESPGSLMVVTPPSYLTLNYKVAQELGIKVSEGMLSRAKEIIR